MTGAISIGQQKDNVPTTTELRRRCENTSESLSFGWTATSDAKGARFAVVVVVVLISSPHLIRILSQAGGANLFTKYLRK